MRKIAIFIIVLLIVSYVPNSISVEEWFVATDMSVPRTEIAATSIGSRIYVIGGFDADGATTNIVEVYNPRNDIWSEGKELPIALHHTVAASYEGKLYVVGGFREGWIPSNTLFIYDPLTNEWTRGKDMPTPRGALTAQFIDGILYAVGGWNGSPLAANEAYDPLRDIWITKASMPTPREHLASGVVDGKLYVIGGRQGTLQTNLNVNEEYNPATDKWTTKASMPSKRGGLAASSILDSIYVFGGETSVKTFPNNEQYLPSLDVWIERETMPTSRHGLVAVEAGGGIYVIGGGLEPGLSTSGKNEVFTPEDWRNIIHVDINPTIGIEPANPTIDDKVKVTVNFATNTSGYTVRFNELERTGRTFTTNVTVIPPPSNAVVLPAITEHSHTYTIEKVSAGKYRFAVSINDQKPLTIAKFTVFANPIFIDVEDGGIKNVPWGAPVILERTIKNSRDTSTNFLSILQIKNERGITTSLTWLSGELSGKESRHLSQTWIPSLAGKYTVQIFVWENMENPRIVDSMYEIRINVS
jgi:N-acetylneuraminic acid mutarotase